VKKTLEAVSANLENVKNVSNNARFVKESILIIIARKTRQRVMRLKANLARRGMKLIDLHA